MFFRKSKHKWKCVNGQTWLFLLPAANRWGKCGEPLFKCDRIGATANKWGWSTWAPWTDAYDHCQSESTKPSHSCPDSTSSRMVTISYYFYLNFNYYCGKCAEKKPQGLLWDVKLSLNGIIWESSANFLTRQHTTVFSKVRVESSESGHTWTLSSATTSSRDDDSESD